MYLETLYPTLRANPYPEVTDLFCRLPLPAFVYRLEATHLGDLMRFWVRPSARVYLIPRVFTDRQEHSRRYTKIPLFQAQHHFSG